MKKKRNELIDIFKGVAIILVVIGHCIQYGSGYNFKNELLFFNNFIFKFIYSFHMPFFMLISGYLFYNSDLKKTVFEVIISKIKQILIPIISFSTIIFIIDLCLENVVYNRIINFVISYIKYCFNNLWFLWSILFLTIGFKVLNTILNKLKFKDWLKNITYCLIWLLLLIIPDVFGIQMHKFMYPYFIIGYMFNKYKYEFNIKNSIELIILVVIYILLYSQFSYDTYIYNSGYAIWNRSILQMLYIDIHRFLIGLVGSILCIKIISWIYKNIKTKKIYFILSNLGKKSLGIYAISNIIFTYALFNITFELLTINYGFVLFESIVILLVSYVISYLFSKNKVLNLLFLGNRS